VTLPTNALIQRVDYVNCGEDPYSTGYTLQVTGTNESSVSKQHTVSLTSGVSVDNSFKVSSGIFGGSNDIKVSFSMTLSDQTTNTETHSTTVQQTWPANLTVGVGHAGHLDLLALQQTIQIPFSATVIVDGDLEDNISGLTKASQVLSEADRTLPFSGTITATGLSGAYTGNFATDIDYKNADVTNKTVLTPGNTTTPASLLSPDLVRGLAPLNP
jgi:hypothetical protein